METLIYFFSITIGGIIAEYIIFSVIRRFTKKPLRNNHKYHLLREVSFMSLPIWGLIALIVFQEYSLMKLFITSAIIGTFQSFWLVGFYTELMDTEFGLMTI